LNLSRLFAFVLTLALAPACAMAQLAPPPNSFSKQAPAVKPGTLDTKIPDQTYGDWRLSCRVEGTAPQTKRTCEVVQYVMVPDQQAPFAEIAFGRTSPSEPMLVTVVTPINVSFPSSVRIAVDEKDTQPAELAWRRCLPAGCFANLAVTDDQVKRWRSLQTTGRVSFKSAAGQELIMPTSFRGLGQALDALAKQH
jgi:invasion protein IalB